MGTICIGDWWIGDWWIGDWWIGDWFNIGWEDAGVFRKLCQQKSISFLVINSGFKMNVELQINIVPSYDGLTPVFCDIF